MEYPDSGVVFVATNGKLYRAATFFFKASMAIEGVQITELSGDAYDANFKTSEEVLFPADICSPFPFPITEHEENLEYFKETGGFRLDFYHTIYGEIRRIMSSSKNEIYKYRPKK